MSIKLKFNGGDPVLVFSGTGTVSLESLGLTTRSEVEDLKNELSTMRQMRDAAEAALAKRDAKVTP